MTPEAIEIKHRIASLVDSVRDDHERSQELFHYVWTMMCVNDGLLRVIREEPMNGSVRLILEEVRSGRQRVVSRPRELDPDIEGLAIQALARILGTTEPAG